MPSCTPGPDSRGPGQSLTFRDVYSAAACFESFRATARTVVTVTQCRLLKSKMFTSLRCLVPSCHTRSEHMGDEHGSYR